MSIRQRDRAERGKINDIDAIEVRVGRFEGALMRLRTTFATGIAVAALDAATAFAQSSNELARRELLTQAEASATANDHARAVELLERAGAIQWTPSHRLFIAREYQRVGRLVLALDAASSCEREARADAALRNRAVIEQACAELSTALREQVARIVVRVPADRPAETRVLVAGQPLAEALWGLSLPVNPGSVEVVIDGPGLRPSRTVIAASAGRVTDVELVLDRLPTVSEPDPAAARAPLVEARARRETTSIPRSSPVATTAGVAPVGPRGDHRRSIAPWVLVGAGGAVVGAGVVLTVVHFAATGALESDCRRSSAAGSAPAGSIVTCFETGQQFDRQIRSAETTGTLAVIGLTLGAAVALGGALWGALAPASRERPRATLIAPLLDGRSLGIAVGGEF